MELLEKLNKKATALKARNLLNHGAQQEQITDFEEKLNIKLPDFLRSFYQNCNGGCFADDSWSDDELQDSAERASIIWNSNYFLSLEEIIDAYNLGKFANLDFQEAEKESGKKLIPIMHTNGQENLVWDATDANSTKILDAFHEAGADEWNVLYKSFEDLIEAYIKTSGDIKTIA